MTTLKKAFALMLRYSAALIPNTPYDAPRVHLGPGRHYPGTNN